MTEIKQDGQTKKKASITFIIGAFVLLIICSVCIYYCQQQSYLDTPVSALSDQQRTSLMNNITEEDSRHFTAFILQAEHQLVLNAG